MVHSFLLKTAALVSSTLLASRGAANTDLETVVLTHPSGSNTEIYLFGAHIKSFRSSYDSHREVLFMSNHSYFDGINPIRGGIPIVFPNFGSAKGFVGPDHGFARITKWSIGSVQPTTDLTKDSVATFHMTSSDATRKIWPFDFQLEYEVRLWSTWLETKLTVVNTHSTAISFHALLHNYIYVHDIVKNGVEISGLQGVDFFDKVTKTNQTDSRPSFGITSQVDSIYKKAKSDVIAFIPGGSYDQIVTVQKSGSVIHGGNNADVVDLDCVIWNPWKERAAAMKDFGDEEYLHMIAIEPGKVSEQQVLAPGTQFELKQFIMVSKTS